MHSLTRKQARQIAVRAQLLDAPRPKDLLAVVERLTFLQIDPTAAVAPSADLVAWSRLGSSYRREHLTQALERDRTLFESNALIRPMSNVGLYLAGTRGRRTHETVRAWLRANDRFRRDVLGLLERGGRKRRGWGGGGGRPGFGLAGGEIAEEMGPVLLGGVILRRAGAFLFH